MILVKEVEKSQKKYFLCEVCGFAYNDQKTAEECESWCRKNKSCNLNIIKKHIDLG
jgi:rubrerythrin